MNKYRIGKAVLRMIIVLSSIAILYSIIVPVLIHSKKPFQNIDMIYYSDNNLEDSNLNWIIKQEKYNISESDSPEVLFYSDELIDVDKVLSFSGKNTLIMEKMFQKNNYEEMLSIIRELTGVQFTGYYGKTYFDLSDYDLISDLLVKEYEDLYKKKWEFSGEGIVIQGNQSIIVLEKGKDYDSGLSLKYDNTEIPYKGYFEITYGNNSVGEFSIDLYDSGQEIFQSLGLAASFSAAYNYSSSQVNSYYFAGDYSKLYVGIPSGYDNIGKLMAMKGLYDSNNNEELFWRWYYPKLTEAIESRFEEKEVTYNTLESFKIEGSKIYKINGDGIWREFFIKGMNLGPAIPGRFFTEFPLDKSLYSEWIEQIADMNINTIRIYTLLPPAFYEALYDYNLNSERKIYLLQEIWPEEHPEDLDYLKEKYNNDFKSEIVNVVDAVHGNAIIRKRNYRAYGVYTKDVSQYLLGYIVGRELEPEEVLETDEINRGYTFEGRYLKTGDEASPTEAWLASSCDYTLEIEEKKYNKSPLVGIVSWPTLDYLSHDSEWNELGDKSLQFNDKAVVNINNIDIDKEYVSGFFGAYHIYPNYPDFMNNDKKYDDYEDEYGRFRYGAYLKEFMENHKKYPAIVAEYGISTSMYSAHYSPDKYHHGGLDENMQAEGIIRMTDAIIREGYSGAIIFEWMDEWAKKTWTTEPYMIPYDKNPFWHNIMDPEQNYGILAYDSPEKKEKTVYSNENGKVKEINMSDDEQFLSIKLKISKIYDTEFPIKIYIDTVKEDDERIFEFVINLESDKRILVNPNYNWLKGKYKATDFDFNDYETLNQLINKKNVDKYGNVIDEYYENLSILSEGSFDIPQNNLQIDNDTISIRLPYGLLAYSDPSENLTLYDERIILTSLRDKIDTRKSNELGLLLEFANEKVDINYELNTWNNPQYEVRLKKSYEILKDYFRKIN